MARPSGSGGTVSTLTMQPVARALRRMNIDPERIFGACGIPLQLVEDPYARLPESAEVAVWETLVSATRDPLIGLRIADEIARGALGAYEYALRNSPTLRHAFGLASRYMSVIDDRAKLAIVEADGVASVQLGHLEGSVYPPEGIECTFAVAARALRATGGDRGRPVEVQFQHRALGPLSEYEARFACPVRFECPHNAGVFPASLLDLPNLEADPRLLEVLEAQLARALQELPTEDPWLRRARLQLAQLLASGAASLPNLAAALHTSSRTLRRTFAQYATSYSQLLDEVRREVASFYVRRTHESFEQIAGRIGFADTCAFYRAFRRWHDTTPAALRAQSSTAP